MLNISASQDLPIFSFQYLSYLGLVVLWLLWKPTLKKSHFWIEERSMGLLSLITNFFSEVFALPQNILGSVEYFLDWIEAVGHKVAMNITFKGLGIVVTLEVEDPVCIEMRVNWHVKSIWVLTNLVLRAVLVKVLVKAGIAAQSSTD